MKIANIDIRISSLAVRGGMRNLAPHKTCSSSFFAAFCLEFPSARFPDARALSEITDGASSCAGTAKPVAFVLPTRQCNALRLLLNKPGFSPQEVAALDVRVIERTPGIGRKSLEIIDHWLRSHGYRLSGLPRQQSSRRQQLRQRKLEEAIELLRLSGYEVRRIR
jgi:hypothetical protein